MTPAERDQFAAALGSLGVVFDREVDRSLLEEYFKACRSMSLHAFRRAVETAKKECQWFPKPVELLELGAVHQAAPTYREIDGEPVYACFECLDVGLVLRTLPQGVFGSPCSCSYGLQIAEAWKVRNAGGYSVEQSARRNSERLRRIESNRE